ncbi:pyridoxamine 5'-phosphate oxidase family protein [Streptomyces sp. NRRL S-87]|uniref:pyridoxamine 5'-phosphate oxidase family protein n=1 Tax=Streptomyces sp. NRRL S-87 TaxID=1463920 RepID=UPI0004BEE8BA|nr:pyridoxamine 5'-phosphate oxidase family protein [Streptomyces sp. NRRL S-87]
MGSAPLDALDAYRTCEFATLTRSGTPMAWPTAVARRADGTLLLTTSLAFAQKALNVRRDGRVALLFSDPTGSGLDPAPQIFVSGRAECREEVMTGPQGTEEYWRMLFERQPHSRAYLSAPMRPLMHWYYLRLIITVVPEQVIVRPPRDALAAGAAAVPAGWAGSAPAPAPGPASGTRVGRSRGAARVGGSGSGAAGPRIGGLVGAGQLARCATAVLTARDASGAPVLARTRPLPTAAGYLVDVPSDCAATPGPASLLVHRHDELLDKMYNAVVRGELHRTEAGWLLAPSSVVEPMGSGRAVDAVRVLRRTKRATDRYLDRRGLRRPKVEWDLFRALSESAARREGT